MLEGEAGGACSGDEFADKQAQESVALVFGVFNFAVGDEGAGALLGIEEAADFHLAVGAEDGVGVDGQVDGNLADGGELVAGGEGAGGDCSLDLVDELPVDGDSAMGVEAEGERLWPRFLSGSALSPALGSVLAGSLHGLNNVLIY